MEVETSAVAAEPPALKRPAEEDAESTSPLAKK